MVVRGKLRQHFTLKGRPKRPMTHETALAQALIHRKRAYKCRTCGWWHIGGSA